MSNESKERKLWFICSWYEGGEEHWSYAKTTERGLKMLLTRERSHIGREAEAYQMVDISTREKTLYLGLLYPKLIDEVIIPDEIVHSALAEFDPEREKPKLGRPPIPEEDKVGNRKRITLYLTDEQHEQLKALAKSDGVSVQAYSISKIFYSRLWK